MLGRFSIRYALAPDIGICQALTRVKGVREQLPFVMLPSLRKSVELNQPPAAQLSMF